MITTTINITPYLAEYLFGKFNNGAVEPVHFTEKYDVYHAIWQLMQKRPKELTCIDAGNLAIVLPDRRIGKDPATYNYISNASALIIEKYIRRMFNEELHSMMDDNRNSGRFLQDIEVIHQFMCSYSITSIDEDSLKKNYYRWRENIRKMRKRRNYTRCETTLNI